MKEASVEFYTAYLAVQTELDSLKKNRTGRFKYADLDYLMENLRPVLQKHNMIVLPHQTYGSSGSFLSTRLIHVSTGQGIESSVVLRSFEIPEYDDQMAGKNITYQRRYSLMTLLNITLEDDIADDNGHAMNARREFSKPSSTPTASASTINYDIAQKLKAVINGMQNASALERNILTFNKVSSLDQLREDQYTRVLNYIKEHGVKQNSIGE